MNHAKSKFKTHLRKLLRLFFVALLRRIYKVHVDGDVAGLSATRTLFISNHESLLDGMLLGAFLPSNPIFVIYSGLLKNRLYRITLSLSDYLTVDPANPMAMKSVIRVLSSGRSVLLFPEGRITTTGGLMKVYSGPAFVAAKSQANVVPICLSGTTHSRFSYMRAPYPKHWLPKITIHVLPPCRIQLAQGVAASVARQRASENLRHIMQGSLFTARQPHGSLPSAMINAMRTYGRRRCIMEDVRAVEYSYGDLLKMMLMLGRLLCRHSAEGDRVGLLLPNLAPSVGLIFGLNAFRRTPALLNYSAGSEAIATACKTAQIGCVVTSRAFIEQGKLEGKIEWLQKKMPDVRLVYLEDLRTSIDVRDKIWLLKSLLMPERAIMSQESEQEAVILFSSGSEGTPKGVVLSHRALLANVAQVRTMTDFSVQDRILSALPLFHAFGLLTGSLLPLLSGFHVVLYTSPLHYRVIPELAYDRGCTILVGTSTFLGNYARFAHPYDFHRMRLVIAGAEKLSNNVRQIWAEKFGIRIYEGYGATEAAPVIAVNTPMANKKGSVGQLLPAIKAQTTPVDGIDHGGLLHVQGPNLMSGYLLCEQPGKLHTPPSAAGVGWYDTGDVVEIDEEGFVFIVGRVKRFAKVAGEMVSLDAVESLGQSAASAQALECSCAAIASSDSTRGERITLYVSGDTLNREAVMKAARAQGASELAIPREIVQIEALPLLGSGKVDYPALEKIAK